MYSTTWQNEKDDGEDCVHATLYDYSTFNIPCDMLPGFDGTYPEDFFLDHTEGMHSCLTLYNSFLATTNLNIPCANDKDENDKDEYTEKDELDDEDKKAFEEEDQAKFNRKPFKRCKFTFRVLTIEEFKNLNIVEDSQVYDHHAEVKKLKQELSIVKKIAYPSGRICSTIKLKNSKKPAEKTNAPGRIEPDAAKLAAVKQCGELRDRMDTLSSKNPAWGKGLLKIRSQVPIWKIKKLNDLLMLEYQFEKSHVDTHPRDDSKCFISCDLAEKMYPEWKDGSYITLDKIENGQDYPESYHKMVADLYARSNELESKRKESNKSKKSNEIIYDDIDHDEKWENLLKKNSLKRKADQISTMTEHKIPLLDSVDTCPMCHNTGVKNSEYKKFHDEVYDCEDGSSFIKKSTYPLSITCEFGHVWHNCHVHKQYLFGGIVKYSNSCDDHCTVKGTLPIAYINNHLDSFY